MKAFCCKSLSIGPHTRWRNEFGQICKIVDENVGPHGDCIRIYFCETKKFDRIPTENFYDEFYPVCSNVKKKYMLELDESEASDLVLLLRRNKTRLASEIINQILRIQSSNL